MIRVPAQAMVSLSPTMIPGSYSPPLCVPWNSFVSRTSGVPCSDVVWLPIIPGRPRPYATSKFTATRWRFTRVASSGRNNPFSLHSHIPVHNPLGKITDERQLHILPPDRAHHAYNPRDERYNVEYHERENGWSHQEWYSIHHDTDEQDIQHIDPAKEEQGLYRVKAHKAISMLEEQKKQTCQPERCIAEERRESAAYLVRARINVMKTWHWHLVLLAMTVHRFLGPLVLMLLTII